MINTLKLGELKAEIPAVGFRLETLSYRNVKFTSWDIGGRDMIRPLWRHYYQGITGMIFMVDSTHRERLAEASEALHAQLREDELRGCPLLVLANKQDLDGCMTPTELSDYQTLLTASCALRLCASPRAAMRSGIHSSGSL